MSEQSEPPVDRRALIERIEWMLRRPEYQDEAAEDALLTVLDFLTGWCSPRMRL